MHSVLEEFNAADIPLDVPLPRFASPIHPKRHSSWSDSAHALAGNLPIHNGRVSELRPWQRYALDRALECDSDGKLCWEIVIVSAPRQVGKSVLERIAVMWRLHQSHLFGETQDIVHVAHNYRTAMEIYRPAARWALQTFGKHHVRQAQGQQHIELPDGSRWMIQAATEGAGVGFALSMVLVDEAWRINRAVVDAALLPTMTESNSPQLWLVSTAGTFASDLMKSYRNAAIAGADSILILEWSAPDNTDTSINDPDVWRMASPHWDDKRAEYVKRRNETLTEWDFRQQYLNQWVPNLGKMFLGPDVARNVETLAPIPSVPLSFGVDVATDRSHAAIVAYGAGIAEVIEENTVQRSGVAWVPGRIRELIDAWNPLAVGFDALGPGASIADSLKVDPDYADAILMMSGRDMCAASAQLHDAIVSGGWRVRPHNAMAASLTQAQRRTYGQAWTFARDAPSSGCPVLAAVTALWAQTHAPAPMEASAIW